MASLALAWALVIFSSAPKPRVRSWAREIPAVLTTSAAVGLAKTRRVEMPITEKMHAILHEGKSPREAIHELMTRSAKSETEL